MSLPAWTSPDESKPAPLPLLLVQAFVNTADFDRGTDRLAEPEAATTWLRQAALLGTDAAVTTADLGEARAVREGLRALLAEAAGGAAPGDEQLAPLRRLAANAHPLLTVGAAGRIEVEPAATGGLREGLIRLLLVVRDAQRDGTWSRLKVCRNPGCQWAFYDRSHAQAGAWCDMASCGNVMKNRTLRARRGARARRPGQPAARGRGS